MQPGLPDRGAVHRSKLNDPRRKKTCSAADVKHKDLLWVSGDHSQRVHLDSQVPFSDSRRSSKVLPCDPNLQVCLGYKRTPSSALATPPFHSTHYLCSPLHAATWLALQSRFPAYATYSQVRISQIVPIDPQGQIYLQRCPCLPIRYPLPTSIVPSLPIPPSVSRCFPDVSSP